MSVAADVLRGFAVAFGAVLALTLAAMTFLSRDPATGYRPGDRNWLHAVGIFCTFVVVQEAQQLGKPFVWWRLPFLLLGEVFTARAILARMRRRHH